MKTCMKVFVASFVVFVATVSASATVVTFKDGLNSYTGTQDTQILGYGGNEDNNAGVFSTFFWNDNSSYRYNLIRFTDLTAPTGEVVVSAKLVLSKGTAADAAGSTSITVDAFQIADANASWVEGAGNLEAANEGEATWNNLAHSATTPTPWAGSAGLSTAGTDYAATALDTVTINVGDAQYTKYEWDLDPALVQQWVDGGTNAGLLLRNTSTGAGGYNFVYSSDINLAAQRPELVITFDVPEPGSMALLGLGGAMMMTRSRKSCD